MHPNAGFDWTDEQEMLRFVARQSFAHIFTASDAGQFVQIDSFRCGTGVSRSMNASASRIVANPCSVRSLPWRERMAAKGNPRRHLRD